MTANNFPPAQANVLGVDGDPDQLATYRESLAGLGGTCELAASGQAALQICQTFSPDIIISARDLPDMTVEELYRRLEPASRFVFVMVLPPETADYVPPEGLAIDDFLQSPVSVGELRWKVGAFSQIKHLRDELQQCRGKNARVQEKLGAYKKTLEANKQELEREKALLKKSMEQTALMAEQREKANQELARLLKRQKEDFYNLISILSSAVESKRRHHFGHARVVADIAVFIAKQFELPTATVRHIKIAALLHEIGRLSMPEDLLEKNPADYTPKERALMRQHPSKGAGLLEKFNGFREVATIIRHFHEKLDGSGAPEGLQGDQIPLGSRIIAAANAYENMVYRKTDISTEQVLEKMESEIGSRFDAAVIHHLHKYALANPVDQSLQAEEIRLYDIAPGLTLASGIFTKKGAKLLPAGTFITEKIVDQIDRYREQEPLQDTVFVKR